MIRHSNVSLDYLEGLLQEGKSASLEIFGPPNTPGVVAPLTMQREQLKLWRSKGYSFAPDCDNVTPDGRCAGHGKED